MLATSRSAGSQACSSSNPINTSTSARFSLGTKLGFIGHPMRVLDAGSEAIHTEQLFPDLLGDVRESRPRSDDANLLRENARLKAKQLQG